MDEASEIFDQTQVISQIRGNQNVIFKNRKRPVADYFSKHPGTPQKVTLRGGQEITPSWDLQGFLSVPITRNAS